MGKILRQLFFLIVTSSTLLVGPVESCTCSEYQAGVRETPRMAAFAHQAFTLVTSERKTISETQFSTVQRGATAGAINGSTITFKESNVRLIVITGPEDDMLSYRIQGLRNPTIVLPANATLSVLFINVARDMRHDIRFGHYIGDFVPEPDIRETAGSTKLAKMDTASFNAEELEITANENGAYKYFCSVGAHAKDGMWGNIIIGVQPPPDLKMPERTTHVHKPGDDDEPHHETPAKPGDPKTAAPHDHRMSPVTDAKMPQMSEMNHGGHTMASTVNVGDPMARESSGTAWAPDSSPVYAKMKMTDGGGMWMFMGTAFLRYTDVGSKRDVSVGGKGGRSRVDAPTMFMAMYSHPLGKKGQLGFRSMFSLDPFIERGYGYPLLYQSGELFRGQPIHDRQHPHDLISELAITYSYKFNDKRSLYLYAGYPGEPALGPPMYLHRTSGMNNPDAPIGHHWQDATHITFGVLTAGFSFGKAKIEASVFNGTEPNENRYNLDKPKLNSFSGRFYFNPTKNLAFQISHGHLKNPERSEPDIKILRKSTASVLYNKAFDREHNWASSFIWGQNYANGERTNSFLVESNYDFYKNAVFGRFETVEKSGHDLVLAPILQHDIFRVNAFSVGYIRDLVKGKGIDIGLGGMIKATFNPSCLTPYYGGTSHGGWSIFLRLRPEKMK